MLHSSGSVRGLEHTSSSDDASSKPRGPSRRARIATMVSFFGCLGILLAACSSGSANASGTTSTTTAGAKGSFAAYESCLKSHGVNFAGGFGGGFGGRGAGGPGSGGAPPSSSNMTRPTVSASERATIEKAATACASVRPKFSGGGGGNTEAFAAYRNCLKLHGVTLPTGRGSGSGGFGGGSTSTTSSPKMEAALAACASLRPKGGFGGGGFPGATTTTTS
jgi:hypothetical protein